MLFNMRPNDFYNMMIFFFFFNFLIILHVSAPQIKKQVERCNYKKGGLPGGGSPLQRDTRHLAKTRPRKKLRMDPNRNYLQLPIKEKQNKQGERRRRLGSVNTKPQKKAAVDEKKLE